MNSSASCCEPTADWRGDKVADPMARFAIAVIRFYQRWISPLLPPACRFEPSCSVYAADAIELHGLWRGGWLAFRRILRCQPFSRGGIDPVPLPSTRATRGEHEASR